MKSRLAGLALALLVIATGTGCTVLDRESYSVVIRKKAHQYNPPETAVPVEPEPEVEPDPAVRSDLDELIGLAAPSLQAFRPFAYCHLHHSSHSVESVLAVALAPIDYTTGWSAQVAYQAGVSAIAIILAPIDAILGPPEAPLKVEERRRPSNK